MGADLAIELEERVNGNGRHGTLIDATLPHAAADGASEAEAVDAAGLGAVIESLLLASGAPVPLARLVEALDGPDRREVAAALRALGASYEREGRGFRLVFVAGGYQLRSAPEYARWVRRLLGGRPPRLSRPLLETLAIVAYRQPCTRPEIEAIRGVDADAVLASLVERRLIRILGRKDAPGRPILYGTTKEFLEVFDLPDLQALPPLGELGDGAEGLVARAEAAAERPGAPGDEPATDDGRDG
jgi:segregation and condensation protein B